MNNITHTKCRVCQYEGFIDLFSLGNQFISDFVEKDKVYTGLRCPIDFVYCPNCTLTQLRHTAPQELLYKRHYWYISGRTQTMRDALRDVTRSIESLLWLGEGDVVLDVGSNDSTTLRSYTRQGVIKVAVEPATNLAEQGRQGVDIFIGDFWDAGLYMDKVGKKAKVITCLGMLYDLDQPQKFIDDIAKCLDFNGVFVAQLMCLKNMVVTKDVGNAAHEHLEFYTLKSLNYLLDKAGLEIFDIETNKVNGESYRLFMRHQGSKVGYPRVSKNARVELAEIEDRKYEDPETLLSFFQEIEQNKEECMSFIRDAVKDGAKVSIIGASTKGNVIAQYYGLDNSLITLASERSPEKWGKYMVGTGIPIVSEEEARNSGIDLALVLPYAFRREIIQREKKWLMESPHRRLLFPLPQFEVVGQEVFSEQLV